MPLPIPPPLVVALFGYAMWLLAGRLPFGQFAFAGQRPLAALVALAGLGLMALAAWTMWRARTTVNPLRPERAAHLVTSGVFARSRNPIYLGDLLILGVPGEMAADLGLQLKARARLATGATAVTIGGLADEWVSYILTAEQYRRGGYEASVSFYGETLGATVVEGVLRGLGALRFP